MPRRKKIQRTPREQVLEAERELQKVEREIYTLTVARNALRLQVNRARDVAGMKQVEDWEDARGFKMLAV